MLIVGITLSLLATAPGMKLEEVIAHENMQQGQQLTIDENLHGGKILVLSDGSTWEVAPQSLPISQSWIFPSPLKVEKSKNPAYPYKIIIIQTNTSILVRQIAPYKTGGLDIQSS
ncbi:MAG: hypothetical protein KDK64_04575 [Chlamydiia bacterium]|nr:hypothetical protein [Chlamydiia bacterium]